MKTHFKGPFKEFKYLGVFFNFWTTLRTYLVTYTLLRFWILEFLGKLNNILNYGLINTKEVNWLNRAITLLLSYSFSYIRSVYFFHLLYSILSLHYVIWLGLVLKISLAKYYSHKGYVHGRIVYSNRVVWSGNGPLRWCARIAGSLR